MQFRSLAFFILALHLLLLGVHPASAATCKDLLVRRAKLSEANQLAELDGKTWGVLAATQETIISRIETFEDGQFVAIDQGGTVRGFLNTLRIKRTTLDALANDNASSSDAWSRVTDRAKIRATHDADGELLFLVNLTTDFNPSGQHAFKRRDIGSQLLNAALVFAKSQGLREVSGITRVNGFRKFALKYGLDTHSAEQMNQEIRRYLELVAAGKESDPALSFHLSQGAVVVASQPNAMADDLDSLGWGALIRYTVN